MMKMNFVQKTELKTRKKTLQKQMTIQRNGWQLTVQQQHALDAMQIMQKK